MPPRLALALVALLAAAAPASAAPLEDGVAALEQKDYATALKLLKPWHVSQRPRRAGRRQ